MHIPMHPSHVCRTSCIARVPVSCIRVCKHEVSFIPLSNIGEHASRNFPAHYDDVCPQGRASRRRPPAPSRKEVMPAYACPTHVFRRVRVYVHAHVYTLSYMCTYLNIYICIHLCVCMYTHDPTAALLDAHVYVYTRTHTHMYICVLAYRCNVHVYTHARARKSAAATRQPKWAREGGAREGHRLVARRNER